MSKESLKEITKIQAEIDKLIRSRTKVAKKILKDKKNFTLDERFEVWSKCAIKKDEPWVIHADEYPIIGGMVDDCFPGDYDKYAEYDWEFFLDAAQENFKDCQDPADASWLTEKTRKFSTKAHIDALKEEMINLNFGSFIMNW